MKTFEFIKGEDSIRFDETKPISVSYTMVIKNASSSFIVEIPSFNILFDAKKESDIEWLAEINFKTFFKYWLGVKGVDGLKSHLVSLGFKEHRKKTSLRISTSSQSEVKTISKQNLVLSV